MSSDYKVEDLREIKRENLMADNATFNISLEQYLLQTLGPKHLALSTVVPLTVIYVLIFVTGVFGNISVCAVIIKNASLHTATNYYLFSLAVSDLTLLLLGSSFDGDLIYRLILLLFIFGSPIIYFSTSYILWFFFSLTVMWTLNFPTSNKGCSAKNQMTLLPGLPNDLSVYWQQYPWALGIGLCKIRALVSEMMSYTSVLTIVAFSMERYLAICHPLHHYAMSGLKRAVKIIGFLWIISLLGAAPFAVYTTVNYLDFPPGSGQKVPESGFCAMLAPNIPPNWPIYEISSLVFFLFPMVVILILYIRMGIRIRKRGSGQSLKRLEGSIHETRHSNSRKAVIRMLAAVVIAFFLCWAPFHAQRLLYLYANHFPNFPEINEWMYHIAGIFYYISSTVNPILYNVMSAKYRLAFKKTLCGFVPPQTSVTQKKRFNNTNRLDHSFTYSSPSKHSRTFSQRNKKDQGSDDLIKIGDTNAKSENDCERANLLIKSSKKDGIKTTCSVVVVITPASKKKFKS